MDMNKEKWINEVMNSLDDVKSAEANPFLYNKILSKISKVTPETVSMKLVWLAAASIALLAILNFKIIKSEKSNQVQTASTTETESWTKGYQLTNDNTINYN